ncbi:uncharacterized protein LOC133191033 isoform X2 [Saccostrea echinata]|uniref:uncharacterized protein LOC133191033 isoform X2 n=1 Tax=Saccostrea echinata TaxID=191078 RepID=UPI002A817A15|nr:uncharacterized protein LOC133191033 isoform X2 [Saccostrea echinata]
MTSYHKIYMNHVQSSNLQSQLCAMWKKQTLCDAVIKSDTTLVRAHRVVLVASCPMLQSMENSTSGSHLEIRVTSDICRESIITFLQYLYEGFLMLTEENCRQVERLARMLHMDNIINCCADFNKCLSSSSPYIYGPSDQADFKHVRITKLMKVQECSQKRSQAFENSGSLQSKRFRQSASRISEPFDNTSNDSCTEQQESWQGYVQSQSGVRQEGIELFQVPPSRETVSKTVPPQTVSLSLTTQSSTSTDKGMIDFTKTHREISTSANVPTPDPLCETGLVDLSKVSPFSTPCISEVRSLQTVDSNPDEVIQEGLQSDTIPVTHMEVLQSGDSISHSSSDSSVSFTASMGKDKQLNQGSSSSVQKIGSQKQNSQRKFGEGERSQPCPDFRGTMVDLCAGEDITIVKTEPEDSSYPDHYTELQNPETSQRNEGQITPADWSVSNISLSTEENSPLGELSPRQINRADESHRKDSDAFSDGHDSGEVSFPQDPRSERMHPLVSNESLYSPLPPTGFGQGDLALHLSMFADQVAMQMKDMGTQLIKCSICHKDFSTRYGQKLHMERFHPDPKKSKSKEFPNCKICGKQMASKYALKIHEIKHTGQRAFKCELCGSSFGYKSVLKKHMEVCNLK